MGKLTARTAISTNIDENLLVHVVDTTSTATSYKATLSQLYGIFPKNSSSGVSDINYVTRWTAADELGKGIIRDNGTVVDFNGAGLSVDRLINGQFDTNGATDQFALYLLAETDASGAGGTAHGGHIQVNATAAGANDIRGLLVKAAASVDADVSTVDGLNVQSTANGSGSVGTIKGINVSYVGVGTGKTATNVYGIYVANLYDDGTIANNKYAIYQAGADDPNYFAGLSTFNKTLTIDSASDNKMRLGGSSTSGYIEYYNSLGSRRGYIGFTGATEFRINNEVGGLVRIDGSEIRLGFYDFDGTVIPIPSQDGHVLTYDHSSGLIGLEDPSTINKTLTIDSASDSKLKLKGATTSNFVEYFDSVGTRRAYVGFTGATEFRINNESGGLLRLDGGEIRLGNYDFDGTVIPIPSQDGHVLAYSDTSGKIELKDTSNALQWVKASVDYTDFTSGAVFSVPIYTLPAGYVLHGVKIKHSTAFGGGASVGYFISVGLSSEIEKYSSYFDVNQAVSNTTFQLSQTFDSQNHGSDTSIVATAQSFGDTLNNATSGAADIWLLVSNAAI